MVTKKGLRKLPKCNPAKSFRCGKGCIKNGYVCHKDPVEEGIKQVTETYVKAVESVTPPAPPPIAPTVKKREPDYSHLDDVSWREYSRGFIGSPEEVQEAIRKYGHPTRMTDSETGQDNDENPAFFRSGQETIYVNDRLFPSETMEGNGVYRHEFGHWLDYSIGGQNAATYFSTQPRFNSALRESERRILDSDSPFQLPEKREPDYKALEKQAAIIAGEELGLPTKYAKERKKITRTPAFRDHYSNLISKFRRENPTDINYRAAKAIETLDPLVKEAFYSAPPDQRAKILREIPMATTKAEASFMIAGAISTDRGTNGVDLLGSLTKNQVGWGHSTAYYDKKGIRSQNTETFANLFAIHTGGTPGQRNYGYEIVEKFLGEEVISQYKEALTK